MKITKEELKRMIKEEVEELIEVRDGGGMGGSNNPEGIAARLGAGLPKEIYGEAGGGGFKTPSIEDRIMQDIEDELKSLEDEGTDIGDSKEEFMKKFRRSRFAKRALRVKLNKMKASQGES